MSSEEGQKHIYAQEHQLYYYYNNFKGHTVYLSKNLNITQKWAFKMVYKLAITSAGKMYFTPLTHLFILACKIRHNAR